MKVDIEKAINLYHQNIIFRDIRELCDLSVSQMFVIDDLSATRNEPVWKIERVCSRVNDDMKSVEIERLYEL